MCRHSWNVASVKYNVHNGNIEFLVRKVLDVYRPSLSISDCSDLTVHVVSLLLFHWYTELLIYVANQMEDKLNSNYFHFNWQAHSMSLIIFLFDLQHVRTNAAGLNVLCSGTKYQYNNIQDIFHLNKCIECSSYVINKQLTMVQYKTVYLLGS